MRKLLIATVVLVTPLTYSVPIAHATGTCAGLAVTIQGSDNSTTINGTAGDDVIDAAGGDDTVNANGGNDTVCGGTGDDIIYGYAGNDDIYGQGGWDTILGDGNTDRLNPGTYGNTAPYAEDSHGGPGDDTFYLGTPTGEVGVDEAFGDAGTDIVASDDPATSGKEVFYDGTGTDSWSAQSQSIDEIRQCDDAINESWLGFQGSFYGPLASYC